MCSPLDIVLPTGLCKLVKGGLCFPPNARVIVEDFGASGLGQRSIRVDQLQLGDRVLTAAGTFDEVFFFSHKDDEQRTQYLSFYTNASVCGASHDSWCAPFTVTGDHYVRLHDGSLRVAEDIRVGDIITSMHLGVDVKVSLSRTS